MIYIVYSHSYMFTFKHIMPRKKRQISQSGCYHIIVRGVNHQSIFFDDEDRVKMQNCLKRFCAETAAVIYVYCFMDNHIHMLLQTENEPSLFIKKVSSSYVHYFNQKYDRIGHLFQDRYKSEPVETDAYLLTLARYILRNPQKAGIYLTDAYIWSSWKEIDGPSDISCIDRIADLAGGKQLFKSFVLQDNQDECMDISKSFHLSDQAALEILRNISGESNPLRIKQYPPDQLYYVLRKLEAAHMSDRQIARLTGINRYTLAKIRKMQKETQL